MNNGISKAQPRRSRVRPSKRLQEQLLNAVAAVGADLPRDDPATWTKRQLDEVDQPRAKKARLSNAHQPKVDGEGAQTVDKTPALQHPKPKPPYASFLNTFVDPVQPRSSTDSEHSFVLEWLESAGSDRGTRCRSDSYLHSADDSPPRQLTRSAPAMGYARDADGFIVPPTPASTRPRSRADTDSISLVPSDDTRSSLGLSGGSLVEDPMYRETNLKQNNIYLCSPRDQLPEHVTDLVDQMRKARNSPELSRDTILQDDQLLLLETSAGEAKLEAYFSEKFLPLPSSLDDVLHRSDRQPMLRHTVPKSGSRLRVSNPVPDMLYGYNYSQAFTSGQAAQLSSTGNMTVANSENLTLPFFVIEFKGDGSSGSGSLWVATNQCLGGSASCINIAERLNHQLRQCSEVTAINSAAFSIAVRGMEVRLYISWKHNELDYYMANVDNFLLQDPVHYTKFRKYVRNIIDWGKGRRLREIQDSLETLLEEGRKRTSAAAKSRTPPSAESASSNSSSKTRKTSSTRQCFTGTLTDL